MTTIGCIDRKILDFKQRKLPISETSCAINHIYRPRDALDKTNIPFEAPKCPLQFAHKITTIECIGRKILAFKQCESVQTRQATLLNEIYTILNQSDTFK